MIQKTSACSNGDLIEEQYKYPSNYANLEVGNDYGVKNLQDKHIIDVIVEKSRYIKKPLASSFKLSGSSFSSFYSNIGKPKTIYQIENTELLSNFEPSYSLGGSIIIDIKYKPKIHFDSYDSKGNVIQYTKESNIQNSFQYSNDNTNLISETKNATINETGYTGFENNETNSFDLPTYTNFEFVDKDNAFTGSSALKVPTGYGPGASFNVGKYANDHCGYKASVWVKGSNRAYLHIEVSGNWETHQRAYNIDKTEGWHLLTVELAKPKIPNPEDHELGIKVYIGTDGGEATFDDLRFQPMDAEMTSYTYEPLVGVTSASDANNKPTIYQYDDFGRLILTRDYLGNILKKYDYHYKE